MSKSLFKLKFFFIIVLIILICMFAFFSYVYIIYNSHNQDLKSAYQVTINFVNDLFLKNYDKTYEYLSSKSKQQLSKQQWKEEVLQINHIFTLSKILEPTNYKDIQYKINLSQEPRNSYVANVKVLCKNNNNQKVTRLIKIILVREQNDIVIDTLFIETESNQLKCYIP